MKRVFKYELCRITEVHGGVSSPDEVTVRLPRGAVVRSAGNQRDTLVVWAEVDPDALKYPRRFKLVKTGEEIGQRINYVFIGTVLFFDGEYVVHVYDLGE